MPEEFKITALFPRLVPLSRLIRHENGEFWKRYSNQRTLKMRVFHFHVDRDIVLCSWARHLTLTMPLYTQVYKWVPANLMLGLTLSGE